MAIPIESGLRIQNDSRLRAEHLWEWSVWIAGPDLELEQIESVTYFLHPSFPKPVQEIRDSSSSFRFTAVGWGEFSVRAKVYFRDGRTVQLERWIELRDQQGRTQTDSIGPEGRRPRIFVSHGVVDAGFVQTLREELDKQGVDVATAESLDVGDSLADGLSNELRSSDMMVAIVSDPPSSWVEQEARTAQALDRQVLPVVLGKANVPEPFLSMNRFVMSEHSDVAVLADRIAAAVKNVAVPDE